MTSPTPAQFRAVHGDMGHWQAVDFEIYEHLVESQYAVPPTPRPEPADGAAARPDPNPPAGAGPTGSAG
ncbi:hypothetical protein [Streptomyces sp. NPDC097981]|uniref:hypothetical protein n=1 Tax=Streptomyces sp. NPDC097981 TaxID=3155428 RepID=UPI003325D952